MVDQRSLETDRATGGAFAVNPKTRTAPSATGGDALGDDEVDRDVVRPLNRHAPV